MNTDLEKYFKENNFRDGLYIYPNPGNAGDALISIGTTHFFNKLNLDYQIVMDKKNFDPTGKTVLYSGGGNLVKYYSNSREFFLSNHKKLKKLIILPHTISGNEDILKEFGQNVDIFTRELFSFEHVKKHAPSANVFLSKDMAFYMDVDEVLGHRPMNFFLIILSKFFYKLKNDVRSENIPSPFVLIKSKIKEAKHKLISHDKVLNSFRIDPEKTEIEIPRDNIDLSEVYKFGTEYPYLIPYAAGKFLRYLNKYEVIHTNRLHISIGGAMLGKKVYLYPNSYFKNQAIYEYSLKNSYPNVHWIGDKNK